MLFLQQLKDTALAYPNLKLKQDAQGLTYLKGILDIPDDSGTIVSSFLIEVHHKKGFPFRFPELFEIGGVIPNEEDWHKYNDHSCCITVLADEILKCKYGITVKEFIQQYAIPYFANYLYRIKTGKYLNGEYAHGKSGTLQFYAGLLKTNDKQVWLKCFKYAFGDEKIVYGRNDFCFCGSTKKFKQCHLNPLQELEKIGKQQIIKDLNPPI